MILLQKRRFKPKIRCINPIMAGLGLNQPALFSNIHFSMKKRVLEVPNFVTVPNSLWTFGKSKKIFLVFHSVFTVCLLKISFLTLLQINPKFGYRVKITPYINPINVSKKVWQLHVDLILLVISLLTLPMSVGCNIPLILTQYVVRWVGLVPRFLTMYNTCMFV